LQISAFVEAIEDCASKGNRSNVRSKTLPRLVRIDLAQLEQWEPYARADHAIDFVSGMTDSYAVSLYQCIRGISLP
jgi:dGTPase